MDEPNNLLIHGDGTHQAEPVKASVELRIGAVFIDLFTLFLVIIIPIALLYFNGYRDGLEENISDIINAIYVVIFGFHFKDVVKGHSLGKYLLGIAVRDHNDASVKPPAIKLFIRNLFTLLWFIEIPALVFSKEKTKIGDKITGTDVFRIQKKSRAPTVVIAGIYACILISMILFGTSEYLKSEKSYVAAISYIEKNPAFIDAVGEIQGYGFLPFGDISTSGSRGNAIYVIRIYGSENNIRVRIYLSKKPATGWEVYYYETL